MEEKSTKPACPVDKSVENVENSSVFSEDTLNYPEKEEKTVDNSGESVDNFRKTSG